MTPIQITKDISYLPATEEPFTCDVTFIKTDKATWIFDVGADPAQADYINAIPGPKKVVLSHFHPDHISNLDKIAFDELYISTNTKKYTDKLTQDHKDVEITIVTGTMTFQEEPGITIMELPSSHAKGSLCLLTGDYLLSGDGTYCAEIKGNHHYNTQQLKSLIDLLESIDCTYVTMSHYPHFVQRRDESLALLKDIYKSRKPGDPIISVEYFFNPDGSPKDRATKGA